MRVVVTNKTIIIEEATSTLKAQLNTLLSYRDKSKQYQLRKLSRRPFMRTTPYYKKLQEEAGGTLLEHLPNETISFSSSFYHIIEPLGYDINDQRHATGSSIALPWKNKPFDLRDYQEEAVSMMENRWRGLINFATGLGKTLVAVHAIKRIKRKALIVVPSDQIAQQFYSDLKKAFGDHRVGMYGGGKKKIKDITVGIAASVHKHVDEFKDKGLGLICFDEVHHIAASTFYSIATALADTGKIFGLTATDYRSDGKDVMITAGCGPTICRRDVVWGAKNGWLAQPYFLIREVPTTGNDYRDDKLNNYREHVLNNPVMKKQIEDDVRKFMAAGRAILCLVDQVAHGQELSDNLGVPFATGEDSESSQYVKDFNAGKINCLIATEGKLGEGSDLQRVNVLVLTNFAASKGLVLQCVGRGLRIYEGKDHCMILDYIPMGSKMLHRHAMQRIEFYREITDKVKIIS